MENKFGLKELYDVHLKATYPMRVGNLSFEEGENIISFDSILISNFQEIKSQAAAKGGFDNRTRVLWESTKEVDLVLSQGVFSKRQFALMNNAKMLSESNEKILIDKEEELETNEENFIELKEVPVNRLFCYNESWEKIKPLKVEGKKLFFDKAFQKIIVDYNYLYQRKFDTMIIGQPFYSGYLALEGKTRIKDDETGHIKTGIIRIPKLKIMSQLSLQLGSEAGPQVGTFSAIGYPVGSRENTKAMEIILLDNDIDADID